MAHEQHSKLVKPNKGFFGRNEISFLGSNCTIIKRIVDGVSTHLKDRFSIAYIDADHPSHDTDESETMLPAYSQDMIDKIGYYQFNSYTQVSDYEKDVFFNTVHLTIVNGNHEKANQQLVIIDPKKEASLIKRKASLTQVIGLINLDSNGNYIPEYIKTLIPYWDDLPLISVQNVEAISSCITKTMARQAPPLHGLILGGGASKRMGTDKAAINYHGVPQHEYINSLLTPLCEKVLVSCQEDQTGHYAHTVVDTFLNLGAFGGILSAFRENPNAAWFSIACDIPLLDKETIALLVARRNTSKVATCFYNSETQFPEPLITIWEPRAYPILLHYLSLGYSCPRKVLINSDVEVIKLANEDVLLNANTVVERDKVLQALSVIAK